MYRFDKNAPKKESKKTQTRDFWDRKPRVHWVIYL